MHLTIQLYLAELEYRLLLRHLPDGSARRRDGLARQIKDLENRTGLRAREAVNLIEETLPSPLNTNLSLLAHHSPDLVVVRWQGSLGTWRVSFINREGQLCAEESKHLTHAVVQALEQARPNPKEPK